MAIFNLGERIALARKRMGMKQKELAADLRIDAVTLNRYEKGHRVPDALLIGQLVALLKCDAEWLLLGFEPTHAKQNEVVPRKRHLDSYPEEQVEYIDKLTAIMEHSSPEDLAYLKGVLDTLANKAKLNREKKRA